MENAPPTARLILLGFFMTVTASGGLALKSLVDSPRTAASVPTGDGSAIVALHDGATMIAERGTVAREIVDWLASDKHWGRFELGGSQFAGRSARPTDDAEMRLPRLIMMLKSDSDVDILIVGHSDRSDDPADDLRLSEARASAIRGMLEAEGISTAGIQIEGRGSAEPIADDATPAGRAANERISLELTRHS